jgi:hypothetical protein
VHGLLSLLRLIGPLDINLSELQKTLDAQGIQLVDNQKESVVGRKALADKTKGTLLWLLHARAGLISAQSSRNFPRAKKSRRSRAF